MQLLTWAATGAGLLMISLSIDRVVQGSAAPVTLPGQPEATRTGSEQADLARAVADLRAEKERTARGLEQLTGQLAETRESVAVVLAARPQAEMALDQARRDKSVLDEAIAAGRAALAEAAALRIRLATDNDRLTGQIDAALRDRDAAVAALRGSTEAAEARLDRTRSDYAASARRKVELEEELGVLGARIAALRIEDSALTGEVSLLHDEKGRTELALKRLTGQLAEARKTAAATLAAAQAAEVALDQARRDRDAVNHAITAGRAILAEITARTRQLGLEGGRTAGPGLGDRGVDLIQ